jgi:hypothetical protein
MCVKLRMMGFGWVGKLRGFAGPVSISARDLVARCDPTPR